MAIDKWGQDDEYTQEIRSEYEKIDKELEDEDLAEEISEDLTKEKAE